MSAMNPRDFTTSALQLDLDQVREALEQAGRFQTCSDEDSACKYGASDILNHQRYACSILCPHLFDTDQSEVVNMLRRNTVLILL